MTISQREMRGYRELADAGARQRTGLAAAEGIRLVREALSGDAAVTALYLADDLEPAIAEELAAAAGRRAGGVGVTRVPRDAFARMAHTRHPQGAAAVFAIPATVPIEPGLARWRRIVVANRLADPGNLGTLVRTAEATSCDALLLLGEGCDPWNPKAVRAGMGSHFRVPLVGGLPAERTLRAVSAAGFEVAAAETRGAPSLYDIVFGERVAVLLGGETAGLPFCEGVPFRRFCLPMGGRVDSLNVAQAATAILYELARRGRASCGGA